MRPAHASQNLTLFRSARIQQNVRMRSPIIPVFIVVALLVLSGCSGNESTTSGDSPTAPESSTAPATPSTSQSSQPTKTKTVTRTTTVTKTAKPPKTTKPPKTKKPSKPDHHKTRKSKLALAVHGSKTTIKPTDVYCKGRRGGTIHHIIGKTHNRPPLVKAEGKHFALVKPGEGRPYKANRPSGISYGKDRVRFRKTRLGPATLSGTMICTKWEH